MLRPTLSRLFIIIALVSTSNLALAHAQLLSAVPAVGSVVAVSPDELKLKFSEGIEAKLSKVDLMNATDMIDDNAVLSTDPNDKTVLIAKLKHPLPADTYMVMWRAVSVDTHKTQGDYSFVIKR